MALPTDYSTQDVIYTVAQINQMVHDLFEEAFLPIWVEGEISNFSSPSSGHWYFSLKDEQAQLRCAMFQGKNRIIDFRPQNGMQILARGKLSLYQARGEFQLVIDHLEEAGAGALQRAFEQLKKRLAQEGLFDATYKKSIPRFPKRIGVITSPTGAAIRDILHVLKRRCPLIPIIIYPTLVQGEEAILSIVRTIELADSRAECDVLLLARGGGSLEDLWAFNTEIVARAIFACRIPIISAIGHATDFTISDLVADHYAPTPSAAAEYLSPDQLEYQKYLEKIKQELIYKSKNYLERIQERFLHLYQRLRHPGDKIREQIQRLDLLEESLKLNIGFYLKQQRHTLEYLSSSLQAISPLATLARGYALVTHLKNQQIISSTEQIKIQDHLKIKLNKGTLICQVIHIED